MARVRAPELPQHSWLNSDRPLSLKALRGRVVILDFWTYCCINCLHVLPKLKELEQKYPEHLTVIGIHAAKFAHEQARENVRQAILRYDIEHPVLLDNDFYVWEQYAIRAWPTLVIIDPAGYVVDSTAGEGDRDRLDHLIGNLIQTYQAQGQIDAYTLNLPLEKQPLSTPLAFPGKVVATAETLFIADSGHHRLVATTLAGELQVIGSGEPGLTDGRFEQAQFLNPQGMAFDAQANYLYVADTGNHAIRCVDLSQQTVTTIAGTGVQNRHLRPQQGWATQTALNSPWDLAKVKDNLFIAMAGSHQVWHLHLPTGWLVTYAGTGAEGTVDGARSHSAFAQPSGLTTDGQSLYVADSETSTIRQIDLSDGEVSTVCGSGGLFDFGDRDGVGTEVRLQHCLGVAYADGFVWIADTYNHKIKRVELKTQQCQTLWEHDKDSSSQNQMPFAEPSGLAVTETQIYVADTNHHTIRRLDRETLAVTTLELPELCAPDLCFPTPENQRSLPPNGHNPGQPL